jgi:hypothetical protein
MAQSSPAKIARKLLAADRRTAWPRRFAVLLDLYLAELHDPTPAQVSLVAQARCRGSCGCLGSSGAPSR